MGRVAPYARDALARLPKRSMNDWFTLRLNKSDNSLAKQVGSRRRAACRSQLLLLLQLELTTRATLSQSYSRVKTCFFALMRASIHSGARYRIPNGCWRLSRSTSGNCRAAVRLFVFIRI